MAELLDTGFAKAGQAFSRLTDGEDAVRVTLGIEFICIADHLLLHRFWLQARQPRPCMALSHTGMAFVAFVPQQFAADRSMAQIGFRAVAMDRRRLTPADADVVEHGGFFEERGIEVQLRMAAGYEQAAVGNLSRVLQEQPA